PPTPMTRVGRRAPLCGWACVMPSCETASAPPSGGGPGSAAGAGSSEGPSKRRTSSSVSTIVRGRWERFASAGGPGRGRGAGGVHGGAGGGPLRRVLPPGPGDARPPGLGQGAQVRLLLQVLLRQLADVLPVERRVPGEQLGVDDGEAVLVAPFADVPAVRLGRGVQGGDAAAEQAGGALPFEVLDEAEVGDLHPVADEEEVARLHVEVLEVVPLVHV